MQTFLSLTVVVPFYREIKLIERTVSSVLEQSVVNRSMKFEILICNDGDYTSNDILEILPATVHQYIRIIKNTGPKGPGGARNCGLNHATGEYIAFLDADDYWLPDKISKQLDMMDKGCSFVTTAYQFEGSEKVIAPPESINNGIDIFKKLGIGTSTVLARRSLCDKYRFRNVRFSQDIDYWFRLAQDTDFRYGSVSDSCVVYSLSGSTRNKFVQLMSFWKILQLNKITIIDQLVILMKYSFRGLYNHYLFRFVKPT